MHTVGTKRAPFPSVNSYGMIKHSNIHGSHEINGATREDNVKHQETGRLMGIFTQSIEQVTTQLTPTTDKISATL